MADKTPASAPRPASWSDVRVSPPSLEWSQLPPPVARIRLRILQAVAENDIAALLVPIQWNEVPPLFRHDQPRAFDPIEYLKQRSFDGRGLELLRIVGEVFRQPYAIQTRGSSETYVWPIFPIVAEVEPRASGRLAPWRCVRFADLRLRAKDGGPLIHQTSIGIDGTWHYFWTEE